MEQTKRFTARGVCVVKCSSCMLRRVTLWHNHPTWQHFWTGHKLWHQIYKVADIKVKETWGLVDCRVEFGLRTPINMIDTLYISIHVGLRKDKISTKQKELIIPHWAALIYLNRVDFAVNAQWNAFFLICMQIWFTDEWFDVSSAAPPRHKRQIARWQSLLNMYHFHTAHVYVTNSFTITQLQGDFDQGNEKKKQNKT